MTLWIGGNDLCQESCEVSTVYSNTSPLIFFMKSFQPSYSETKYLDGIEVALDYLNRHVSCAKTICYMTFTSSSAHYYTASQNFCKSGTNH